MKTKILAAVILLLLVSPMAFTQQHIQKDAILTYNYDLASTSYIYCTYLGKNGDPWADAGGNPSPANIKTTGSSTTVDALTASTNPFAQVAVGDLLMIRYGGTAYMRRVTARASADSITVDTAIDLGTAGVPFEWYRASCGTTASDGWLDVNLFYNLTFVRTITTINATSIDSQVECKQNLNPTAAVIIDTKNATAAGAYAVTLYAGAWDACRLGMKVNTDTGAQSITVSVEKNQ